MFPSVFNKLYNDAFVLNEGEEVTLVSGLKLVRKVTGLPRFAALASSMSKSQVLGLDHLQNVPMGWPLLVLDMYEHVYHMDYGAAAARYVMPSCRTSIGKK